MTFEILLPEWIGMAACIGVTIIYLIMMIIYARREILFFLYMFAIGVVIGVVMILIGLIPPNDYIPNLITWKVAGASP